MYVASSLRVRGFAPKFLDLRINPRGWQDCSRWRDELLHEPPDIVGITSTTAQWEDAKRLATLLKDVAPKARVIIGGAHISALPTEALRECPEAEFAVVGDGEISCSELVAEITSASPDFRNVRGIAFRDGSGRPVLTDARPPTMNLDRLPFPAWNLINLRRYTVSPVVKYVPGRTATMMTSRGCPFSCTFCDKGAYGTLWRARSPENVLEEIDLLHGKFHVRNIFFFDDIFTVRKDRVHRLCELLIKRGVPVTWSCQTRVDLVDPETLRIMRQAGCRQIGFGIESGNPRTIAYINKRIDLSRAAETVRMVQRTGIEAKCLFMIGFPNETARDVWQTVKTAIAMNPRFAVFSVVTPYPHTPLWYELKDKLQFTSWAQFNPYGTAKPVYIPPGMSRGEILRLYEAAYRAFYLRPSYLLRSLISALRHPIELPRLVQAISVFKLFRGNRWRSLRMVDRAGGTLTHNADAHERV